MPTISIDERCRLAEVSLAGYYRWLQGSAPNEEEMELRDQLQKLAARTGQRHGYRVLTHLLKRQGRVVNHKRVLRLMQEDNLLCLRRKKYVMTTDARHDHAIYTNLARSMRVTGVNQLWVADITFIRLQREFIYLAVVIDAHSRRVIGWALDRTLRAELAMEALEQALCERQWEPGRLVHHSDRGVQYACGAYTDRLEQRGIGISMSRAGNPYDNARAERFMRTLKQEEVNAAQYRDLEDARARIGEFLDLYNRERLHSALGYVPPVEFEQGLAEPTTKPTEANDDGEAVETAGAVDDRGKPQSRFPTAAPRSLEIPAGFPLFPQPETTTDLE